MQHGLGVKLLAQVIVAHLAGLEHTGYVTADGSLSIGVNQHITDGDIRIVAHSGGRSTPAPSTTRCSGEGKGEVGLLVALACPHEALHFGGLARGFAYLVEGSDASVTLDFQLEDGATAGESWPSMCCGYRRSSARRRRRAR